MRTGKEPGIGRAAPELIVRVPGAQQHKLAALLHGAVHRVPDQVDALRAGAGSAAVACARPAGRGSEGPQAGHLLWHQARDAGHDRGASVHPQAQAQLQVPARARARAAALASAPRSTRPEDRVQLERRKGCGSERVRRLRPGAPLAQRLALRRGRAVQGRQERVRRGVPQGRVDAVEHALLASRPGVRSTPSILVDMHGLAAHVLALGTPQARQP